MKKAFKIAIIFLIIFNFCSITFQVQADEKDKVESIWNIGANFLGMGVNAGVKDFNNDEFGNLIGSLWGIGLLVIFITTVLLGIRYMLVDPNERSKIKQVTTPYIIGVVIIFGALTIWRFIIQILER